MSSGTPYRWLAKGFAFITPLCLLVCAEADGKRAKARDLPEVVVESRGKKVLHILAYVREYSTLTTYTDTVFLFREKMVDFMVPGRHRNRFRGWRYPRILKSRSYYRFTDSHGLDSVSDECRHHFTWSDWVGVLPEMEIPEHISVNKIATDTVMGSYSPGEIWSRNGDRVSVSVNVLADKTERKWAPNLAAFFRNKNIDFEKFSLTVDYENVNGNRLIPLDLNGYRFEIESVGRGRGMFRFNRAGESYFVSTSSEVYILDKEYITEKEARKWESRVFDDDEMDIYESPEAKPLSPTVLALIDRVNGIDKEKIKLDLAPDRRLVSRKVKRSLGYRVLQLVKDALGISQARARWKLNKQWREFKKENRKRAGETHRQDSVPNPAD